MERCPRFDDHIKLVTFLLFPKSMPSKFRVHVSCPRFVSTPFQYGNGGRGYFMTAQQIRSGQVGCIIVVIRKRAWTNSREAGSS